MLIGYAKVSQAFAVNEFGCRKSAVKLILPGG
jgi:hypothetical protein